MADLKQKTVADMSLEEGLGWMRAAATPDETDARREKFFLHHLERLRKDSFDKSADALERPQNGKARNAAALAAGELLKYSYADSYVQNEIAERRKKAAV